MTQASPAKVQVERINQVGLVVKDLQTTVENYWNILGIGPWYIYSWEAPLIYNRRYHGKPTWGREKIAVAQVGRVQLELCQPVDGDSIYQDFLMGHGEGLHHVQFLVENVDEVAEVLAKEGFPSLQSGHFGPAEYKGAYNYIDIKPLHTIWELVHIGGDIGVEPTRYPEDKAQTSPAKVQVERINQVSLVVKDLQTTVENYWNILGIGPWDIYSWEVPLVYNRRYHGKPARTKEKMAVAQVGRVQLELCQPVDGDSIYQDFLMEHGEGLHHLQFLIEDVDEVAEVLAKEGFPSLQSGHFGPAEYKGAYNYIDIKPLHTIWEPVHIGGDIGVEPTRYPED